VVRTTSYSLPEELHDHIELVQPTTIFASFRGLKTTFRWQGDDEDTSHHYATLTNASGGGVDPSCNTTITVSCLKQLYNAVDYEACPEKSRNSIGITGYLEEFANLEDLKRFYADQLPAAVNTSFTFQSVKGN
jgi:tripeptidyl-peptidase I